MTRQPHGTLNRCDSTHARPASRGRRCARRLHSPLAPASSWWSTGAPAATRPT